MLLQGMSISIVGIIQAGAMFSAYSLGRMGEIPKDKWPKGSFFQGGWESWRIVYFVLLGLGVALTVLYPMISNSGLLGGMGMGGGYGGAYGGGGFGRY